MQLQTHHVFLVFLACLVREQDQRGGDWVAALPILFPNQKSQNTPSSLACHSKNLMFFWFLRFGNGISGGGWGAVRARNTEIIYPTGPSKTTGK